MGLGVGHGLDGERDSQECVSLGVFRDKLYFKVYLKAPHLVFSLVVSLGTGRSTCCGFREYLQKCIRFVVRGPGHLFALLQVQLIEVEHRLLDVGQLEFPLGFEVTRFLTLETNWGLHCHPYFSYSAVIVEDDSRWTTKMFSGLIYVEMAVLLYDNLTDDR